MIVTQTVDWEKQTMRSWRTKNNTAKKKVASSSSMSFNRLKSLKMISPRWKIVTLVTQDCILWYALSTIVIQTPRKNYITILDSLDSIFNFWISSYMVQPFLPRKHGSPSHRAMVVSPQDELWLGHVISPRNMPWIYEVFKQL